MCPVLNNAIGKHCPLLCMAMINIGASSIETLLHFFGAFGHNRHQTTRLIVALKSKTLIGDHSNKCMHT